MNQQIQRGNDVPPACFDVRSSESSRGPPARPVSAGLLRVTRRGPGLKGSPIAEPSKRKTSWPHSQGTHMRTGPKEGYTATRIAKLKVKPQSETGSNGPHATLKCQQLSSNSGPLAPQLHLLWTEHGAGHEGRAREAPGLCFWVAVEKLRLKLLRYRSKICTTR